MAPVEIQILSTYLATALLDSAHHLDVCAAFTQKLTSRFVPHHWFPEEPERGSGYRAVSFDPARQDAYLDPVLCILAQLLRISTRDLRRIILRNCGDTHSSGWTIWCDPGCVSIRLQASGGELKELWGNLPSHMSHRRTASYSPASVPTRRSSPAESSSPNKSRAIPILAPASLARLEVIPPTPNTAHPVSHESDPETEEDAHAHAMLANHLHAQFHLASYCSSLDDRPASRASCASSSSDGSDNSGFSSSSSSTATSIAPLAFYMAKKMNAMPFQTAPATHFPAGFIRHHSSSSVPFASNNIVPSPVTNSMVSLQAQAGQTAFPVYASQRRRHMATSSVSSSGSGRGLLVLKGGPGTVTEHSGGKVGVMGGGVLLGLPKSKQPSVSLVSTSTRRASNRRVRTGPAHS